MTKRVHLECTSTSFRHCMLGLDTLSAETICSETYPSEHIFPIYCSQDSSQSKMGDSLYMCMQCQQGRLLAWLKVKTGHIRGDWPVLLIPLIRHWVSLGSHHSALTPWVPRIQEWVAITTSRKVPLMVAANWNDIKSDPVIISYGSHLACVFSKAKSQHFFWQQGSNQEEPKDEDDCQKEYWNHNDQPLTLRQSCKESWTRVLASSHCKLPSHIQILEHTIYHLANKGTPQ